MDIEQRLRDSLAAREAPDRFADAVVARVQANAGVAVIPPAKRRYFGWRVPAALAATVMAAAFALHWHAEQQRATENRQQLVLALAITSHKLDQVQRKLVRTETERPQENGT